MTRATRAGVQRIVNDNIFHKSEIDAIVPKQVERGRALESVIGGGVNSEAEGCGDSSAAAGLGARHRGCLVGVGFMISTAMPRDLRPLEGRQWAVKWGPKKINLDSRATH